MGSGAARGATPSPSQPSPHVKENALTFAKRLEALSRLLQNRKHHVLRMANLLAAPRSTAAFAPFRFPGPVRTLLAETQAQVDAVLANTS
jgi:Na+-transporting NADH:ubiquinone oxidoreductase subunit NqrA